jgi:hypothetical protein
MKLSLKTDEGGFPVVFQAFLGQHALHFPFLDHFHCFFSFLHLLHDGLIHAASGHLSPLGHSCEAFVGDGGSTTLLLSLQC